jgi:predicted XRE-type DNA-binding protein
VATGTEAMETSQAMRQGIIMGLKRWRALNKLSQHQAAKALGAGRTTVASEYAHTKLETLFHFWDRIGGKIGFVLVEPPDGTPP